MSVVWLNGALLPAEEARIDPADRGFTLGDGVFETIAVRRGVALRLEAHFARLLEGARVLGFLAPAVDVLRQAVDAVLAANAAREAVLRITLTRGIAARGVLPVGEVRPTVLMATATLPAALPPARCVIATGTRRNEFSPLSHIKSTNYADSILARAEAVARGADEALVLNTAGRLAEAAAANVFLRVDGRWVTPPTSDGALPGVMREALLAARFGRETEIDAGVLETAEAGVLTSSLDIRSIMAINGRALEAVPQAQNEWFQGLVLGGLGSGPPSVRGPMPRGQRPWPF